MFDQFNLFIDWLGDKIGLSPNITLVLLVIVLYYGYKIIRNKIRKQKGLCVKCGKKLEMFGEKLRCMNCECFCKVCGELIGIGDTKCKTCGREFKETKTEEKEVKCRGCGDIFMDYELKEGFCEDCIDDMDVEELREIKKKEEVKKEEKEIKEIKEEYIPIKAVKIKTKEVDESYFDKEM